MTFTPERLRQIRQDARLSQEELAKYLGVCRVTINRWENKHFKPHRWIKKEVVARLTQLAKKVYYV
jgi:transcriptional regulator with XRE-family HTH domain